jgi:hypothetical protein
VDELAALLSFDVDFLGVILLNFVIGLLGIAVAGSEFTGVAGVTDIAGIEFDWMINPGTVGSWNDS